MKAQLMDCSRRRLPWRGQLLCGVASLFFVVISAAAQLPGGSLPPIPAPATGLEPAYLYAIHSDGLLSWHRHDGTRTGSGINRPGSWQGSRPVGRGWANFKQVFAGDNGTIYVITQQGILRRYQHTGSVTGLGLNEPGSWVAPQDIASGWDKFNQAFSGGKGVIYAITQEGILKWFRHTGFEDGKAIWEGPKNVGRGWTGFRQVFAAGDGIIYAITQDGTLQWRRHLGYLSGAGLETPGAWEGPKNIATGWGSINAWGGFKQVFTAGLRSEGTATFDGALIYAISYDDKLLWARHKGFRDGSANWQGPQQVGNGWIHFKQVFALLSNRPTVAPPDPNAPIEAHAHPFIKNVEVQPDTREVIISFNSTQKTPPLIEIGKVKPESGQDGLLTFPFNSGAFSRFVPGNNGIYTLNLGSLNEQLDISTKYYFVIKVFNDDKSATRWRHDQWQGEFTTLPQTVKVVWEKILIEDDSDDLSTGEGQFWFWANYGQPSGRSAPIYYNGDLDSGHNYYPNRSVVIDNAPDHLTISASGFDKDAGFTDSDQSVPPPLDSPSGSFLSGNDKNVGKTEFDLAQFPGYSVTVPFRLNSIPGGRFKFVVFGHLEISRPTPRSDKRP
jgi:hypothetical protein